MSAKQPKPADRNRCFLVTRMSKIYGRSNHKSIDIIDNLKYLFLSTMQLTASQLQSKHKALIDALKRGETVEITYHGQTLGIVHPAVPTANSQEQEAAMNEFFGMHRDLGVANVESELRDIRKGRRRSLGDL